MANDSYYFPHDSNASHDPKCAALIKEQGMFGYGIYWVLVEILHEQGGKIEKFPKLLDGLAYELKIEKEVIAKQIEALINDYKLLKENEKYIWSDRVIKNLKKRHAKYTIKSQAGRVGGLRSGESRKKKLLEAELEANEQKERKGKEIKGKESKGKRTHREYVFLTTEEHEKLKSKVGKYQAEDYIDRVNNYVGSRGKKYASHYHTILSWWIKDGKPVDKKDREEKASSELLHKYGGETNPEGQQKVKELLNLAMPKG